MIVGYETLMIAGILVVLFLFGSKKIPEFARSLGQAKRTFEDSSKGLETMDLTKATDDQLLVSAQKLSINVTGKTREQILKEIVDRATVGSK